MADKKISDCTPALEINADDLFVLEQNGQSKKLTGQVLLAWLTSAADGHGGIQSINKIGTSGLVDTYRVSLADGTSTTFTVTNGAKGDPGAADHLYIKYAAQQPTTASHEMSDVPDEWIGVCVTTEGSAPTDWNRYTWYKQKGEWGAIGTPASVLSGKVTYQVSTYNTIIPSGLWSEDIPNVLQGRYLWTKTEIQFNSGDPVIFYSVTRNGLDGAGSLRTINNLSADENGNLTLTAEDVGAANAEHEHEMYAPKEHVHSASDVSSGTLAVERLPVVTIAKGGTGSSNGATGLKNLLAAGATVLSAKQFGTALPSAGTPGRIFFKKVT